MILAVGRTSLLHECTSSLAARAIPPIRKKRTFKPSRASGRMGWKVKLSFMVMRIK